MGAEIFLSFHLSEEDCIQTKSYVTVSSIGIFREKKNGQEEKQTIIYS